MSVSFFLPSSDRDGGYTGFDPPQSLSRKRKRSESDQDDVLDGHSSKPTGSPEDTPASSPHLKAQHPANEQGSDTDILVSKNFPHMKLSEDKIKLNDALDDAKLRLPFRSRHDLKNTLMSDVSSTITFRQQHIAALTTILHRGILEGDYIRAGRAWGILLRTGSIFRTGTRPSGTEIKNHRLYAHDRWGIGAEILCRRRSQPIERTLSQERSSNNEDDSREQTLFTSKQWFSSEGFDLARCYFERLIQLHPYQIRAPDALSALDYYPAMFGLWICSEQERYELSLKSFREADNKPTQELGIPEHMGNEHLFTRSHTTTTLQEEDIKKAYLQRGQQIADKLNELMVSPPFSECRRLMDLQSMVNRWIGDLRISIPPS